MESIRQIGDIRGSRNDGFDREYREVNSKKSGTYKLFKESLVQVKKVADLEGRQRKSTGKRQRQINNKFNENDPPL